MSSRRVYRIGGNAYMVGQGETQNCILVENGNLPLLGEMLEQVLLTILTDRQSYTNIIRQALTTAASYQTRAAEAESLQFFFENLGVKKAR